MAIIFIQKPIGKRQTLNTLRKTILQYFCKIIADLKSEDKTLREESDISKSVKIETLYSIIIRGLPTSQSGFSIMGLLLTHSWFSSVFYKPEIGINECDR